MKRLPREKRNQFVIVIAATLGVLALIVFGLIQPQYASLSKIAATRKSTDAKLLNIKHSITNIDAITSELAETTYALTRAEEDMASGDPYSWTYDTIRRFKQPYKVEIPEVGHPTIGEMNLLASFPYKQIRFTIEGTAYYHDLGKFIADFENNFPHARMVNLAIEPSSGMDANTEKLSFKMDVIALVKPQLLIIK